MAANLKDQRATWWQKALLVVCLLTLFLFGVAAEQPAQKDCCYGTPCQITLYPVRIDKLEFGQKKYVTVQFECSGENTAGKISVKKAGAGISVKLNNDVLEVTALELSKLSDENLLAIVRNEVLSRSKPGATMVETLKYPEFATPNLDTLLIQGNTAVKLTGEYTDKDGKKHQVSCLYPVGLDIDAVMEKYLGERSADR
jgi:hypothetical protein